VWDRRSGVQPAYIFVSHCRAGLMPGSCCIDSFWGQTSLLLVLKYTCMGATPVNTVRLGTHGDC
jgi:hypothetical protein